MTKVGREDLPIDWIEKVLYKYPLNEKKVSRVRRDNKRLYI